MNRQTKTKSNHGGARLGAGRKGKGIKTIAISFRAPEEIAPALRDKINALIKKEVAKTIKLL